MHRRQLRTRGARVHHSATSAPIEALASLQDGQGRSVRGDRPPEEASSSLEGRERPSVRG